MYTLHSSHLLLLFLRKHSGFSSRDMDSLDVYYSGTFEPQNHDSVDREPPACLYSRRTEQVPYLELHGNAALGNQDRDLAPYELPSCQHTSSPGYLQAEGPQADAYHQRTNETTAHMAFPWMRASRSQICQAPMAGNTPARLRISLQFSLVLLQCTYWISLGEHQWRTFKCRFIQH